MSVTDINAAFPVLKPYFSSQPVRDMLERKHPFLAMIPKDEGASGYDYPQPIQIGTPSGSADFASASANSNSSVFGQFQSLFAPNYTIARVLNQAIKASRNSTGGFIKVLQNAITSAMRNAYKRDGFALYRTGTGSIGQVSTLVSGVITLTVPTDALAFQVGQVLQASTTDGSTPFATTATVTGSDVSTGTVSITPAAPVGWYSGSNGDFLLSKGDSNVQLKGLGIWLPSTSTLRPVSGTPKVFEGVDRSVAPTELAGVYMDLRSVTLEDALIALASQVRMVGGSPDVIFVNNVTYQALQRSLQSRHVYVSTSMTNDAGIEFPGIELGSTVVMEDPDCPARTAYAIQLDTWVLASLDGKAADILPTNDGSMAFDDLDNDAVSIRCGGYRALSCSAPGWNGVALLGQ